MNTPPSKTIWSRITAATHIIWGAPEDGDDADFRVIGAHDPFSDQ